MFCEENKMTYIPVYMYIGEWVGGKVCPHNYYVRSFY